MLAKPRCAGCVLEDLMSAAKRLNLDPSLQLKIAREALEFLAKDFSLDKIPSYYITAVHRILKKVSGLKTPFSAERRRANLMGLEIAQKISAEADKLKGFDRFDFISRWILVANSLDSRSPGTGYGFDVSQAEDLLKAYLKKDLAINDLKRAYALAKGTKRVLYILDNVGEIALDKILIKELKQFGAQVTAAIRGGPITSDATLEDGEEVNLKEATSSIIVAGPDTLGISFEEMTEEMEGAIKNADLIIAKGQANYYVLSEHLQEISGHILCLFTTKCDEVANIFGQWGKVNIAAIIK